MSDERTFLRETSPATEANGHVPETDSHKSYGATAAIQDTQSDNGSKEKDSDVKKDTYPPISLGTLFSYATGGDALLMFLGTLAAVIHGGGWPALSIVFGEMTNDFVQGPGPNDWCDANQTFYPNGTPPTNSSGGDDDFTDNMNRYAIYFMIIGGGVFVAAYLQVVCWMIACERQAHRLRIAFLKAVLRQEVAWLDTQQSGALTTHLADDIERVREGMGDKFALSIQFTAQFVSGFAIAFWRSWELTLVIMSMTPLLAACAVMFGRVVSTLSKREQEIYASAGGIAEEVISCVRTVIAFSGQSKECKRYDVELEKSQKLGVKKSLAMSGGTAFTYLCLFSTYGLAFWYGTTRMVYKYRESYCEEGISPGVVMTTFFCVMIGSFSLGHIGTNLGAFFTAKGSAAFLHWVIANKPKISVESLSGVVPHSIKGDIDFNGVNFTYPSRKEVQILHNTSISIPAGKTVALVGASGCGKSTLLALLQRFYDPDSGKVCLDGVDISKLRLDWLRSQIGIVSQEPILFGLTIFENIHLGNPQATSAQVRECAKAANAHDFIETLPGGYDTMVGERGAQLSGGQKQRVAIARALLRNPRILLLDEATSALDSQSEAVVQSALERASEGRTTIVIAHRLSTIQNADLICVLEDGRVVEQGNHTELMERKAAYYQLVTLQALASADEGANNVEDESNKQVKKQLSRNLSRGISRISEKGKDLDDDEDAEEAEDIPPSVGMGAILKLNTPELPFMLAGWVGAIIVGSAMPVFAVLFSEVIKVFGYSGQKLKDEGLFWSMMFLVLGGASGAGYALLQSMFGISGERLTRRLRYMCFKQILRQDASFFDLPRNNTGAISTRLATDAAMVKNATGIRVSIVLQSIVALIAGITIAMYYGWKLALAIVGAIPLVMISGALQMKAFKGNQKRDSELMEKAGKLASEAVENVRTVQALGREQFFYMAYIEALAKPHRQNIKHTFLYGLAYGVSQAVIFLLYGGAFRFGAYLVSEGDMPYYDVYRVFSAIAFTGMAIGQSSSFLPDYTKAKASAAQIMRILHLKPGIDSYSTMGLKPTPCSGSIKFTNVTFSYPNRPTVEVLKKLQLEVAPGQTLALVGPSGCGKSTIASLIQRMYDSQQGCVSIDGTDVRDLNIDWLRSQISVVAQEPVLFDCTIRENIGYGVEGPTSMEEITEAARQANAHDFITSLPMGYDTMVGEKGTQLSGGQKQRVAIARALLRNPRILLLDEATSALDTQSEKVVQEALDQARHGRTCVVIAHRLATVQNADAIAVIEGGKLVETGTHSDLLRKKGAYYALSQRQANLNK